MWCLLKYRLNYYELNNSELKHFPSGLYTNSNSKWKYIENTFDWLYSILLQWKLGFGKVPDWTGGRRLHVLTSPGKQQTYNMEDHIISAVFGFVLMLFLKQHHSITLIVFFDLLRSRRECYLLTWLICGKHTRKHWRFSVFFLVRTFIKRAGLLQKSTNSHDNLLNNCSTSTCSTCRILVQVKSKLLITHSYT